MRYTHDRVVDGYARGHSGSLVHVLQGLADMNHRGDVFPTMQEFLPVYTSMQFRVSSDKLLSKLLTCLSL